MKFKILICIFSLSISHVFAACHPHDTPVLLEDLYNSNSYVFVARIKAVKIQYAYTVFAYIDATNVSYELISPALKGEVPDKLKLNSNACDSTLIDGEYLVFTTSVEKEAGVNAAILLASPKVSAWANEMALNWIREKQSLTELR